MMTFDEGDAELYARIANRRHEITELLGEPKYGDVCRRVYDLEEKVRRVTEGCVACGSLRSDPRPLFKNLRFCDADFNALWGHVREHFVPSRTAVEEKRPTASLGTVYFAKLPTGYIKIGVTCALDNRMRALDAECLATIDGGLDQERSMQSKFEHLRVRKDREWYESAPELLAFVAALPSVRRTSTGVALLPIQGAMAS